MKTQSILIVILLLSQLIHSQLVFVQSLFRHGARYPTKPTYTDGTQYAATGNLAGELTDEGKRMQFLLGQKFKQQYWEKLGLNNTFNTSNLYIRSTNMNRTLESGQSLFLGIVESLNPETITKQQAVVAVPPFSGRLFKTPSGPVFFNSPRYRPKALVTEKQGIDSLKNGEFLHSHKPINCPKSKVWEKQGKKSELYKAVTKMDSISIAMEALHEALNDSSITFKQAATFYSNSKCSYSLGKNYSSVFDTYRQDFKFIQEFVKYTSISSNDIQINATVTGFFNATLNNMYSIMKNKQRNKVVLYSAHDTTIIVVLAGLRLGSRQCSLNHYLNPTAPSDCIYQLPSFGTSLNLQLHLLNFQYFVKLRYKGEYIKMPFCSSKNCRFNQFEKFFKETMRSSFMEDCEVPIVVTKSNVEGLIIANVLGLLLILAIGYEIWMVVSRRKVQEVVYQEHVEELQ